MSLGLFPEQNNRGEWFYQDYLLVGRVGADIDSSELGIHKIIHKKRRHPESSLSIREEKAEGTLEEDFVLHVGAKQFCEDRLQHRRAHGIAGLSVRLCVRPPYGTAKKTWRR